MLRICLTTAILGALMPVAASAQNVNPYGGGSSPYAPNQYNRNTQPLSPYLNLLRGGNPAVNYFYGVQPGLMNGAFRSPLAGNSQMQGRQTFFPQTDNLYDLENVSPLDGFRATGHPIGFNNTLNYFGSGSSMGAVGQRSQQGAAMGRPRSAAGSR